MLPASPDTFGNLKDVFPAVLASLAGQANVFDLKDVRHAVVVMIDGLGFYNLHDNKSHAPFLSRVLGRTPELFSGFPSSTVASITSLASGVAPAEHGLFGYRIFDRLLERDCNLLTGMDRFSILDYLRVEPLSSSHSITAITRPEYVDSGFSRATMTGPTLTATDVAERISLARDLAAKEAGASYLYIPELDQSAHAKGVNSPEWSDLLTEIDQLLAAMIGNLPSDVGLLVVADHGVVDVDTSRHLLLEQVLNGDDLLAVGGDPRATFIYLRDSAEATRAQLALSNWLGERASVLSTEELFEKGLFGAKLSEEPDLLPDLVVLAADGYACYHSDFAKPASLRMIGQHGGLSAAECALPLLRFGGYSSSDSDLVP
ncbi:MAG: hypothetical protein RLZZ164_1079 [Actinomycetota bacterium]